MITGNKITVLAFKSSPKRENTKPTHTKSVVDIRPVFPLSEDPHGNVVGDGDVDELLGRVDGREDGLQVLRSASRTKRERGGGQKSAHLLKI